MADGDSKQHLATIQTPTAPPLSPASAAVSLCRVCLMDAAVGQWSPCCSRRCYDLSQRIPVVDETVAGTMESLSGGATLPMPLVENESLGVIFMHYLTSWWSHHAANGVPLFLAWEKTHNAEDEAERRPVEASNLASFTHRSHGTVVLCSAKVISVGAVVGNVASNNDAGHFACLSVADGVEHDHGAWKDSVCSLPPSQRRLLSYLPTATLSAALVARYLAEAANGDKATGHCDASGSTAEDAAGAFEALFLRFVFLRSSLEFPAGLARDTTTTLASPAPARAFSFPFSATTHSCAPSLYLAHDGTCVAQRCIDALHRLSLSRLRSCELRMSRTVRQEILALAHGTPACRCIRCEEDLDYARGVHCPSCHRGTLYRSEAVVRNHNPCHSGVAEPWVCVHCRDAFSDDDIVSTSQEERCSERTYALWLHLSGVDAQLHALQKTDFKELRDVSTLVHERLGDAHWCSLLLAEAAVLFYRAFLRKFALETIREAQKLIVDWCGRWARLALRQRFADYCPAEAAAFVSLCRDSLQGNPTLRASERVLDRCAAALRGGGGERYTNSDAAECFRELLRVTQQLTSDSSGDGGVLSSLELFDAWESYLSDRVSRSFQQHPVSSGPLGKDFLQRVASSNHAE